MYKQCQNGYSRVLSRCNQERRPTASCPTFLDKSGRKPRRAQGEHCNSTQKRVLIVWNSALQMNRQVTFHFAQ